jgi:phospholipase/carboxylesterase
MSLTVLSPDYTLPPTSGGTARSLVLLLHGVGANGEDLMSLAEGWQRELPHTAFISPNAPFPYDGEFSPLEAYQWFSLEGITAENREERVREAIPLLNRFIDEQLAAYALQPHQLALVGFSQGTIVSLYASLRRPSPIAAVLGYAGRLAKHSPYAHEVCAHPRTVLIHGTEDSVIPLSEFHTAMQVLEAHRVPTMGWTSPGVPHTICPEGESLGGAFLSFALENPEAPLEAFLKTPAGIAPTRLQKVTTSQQTL